MMKQIKRLSDLTPDPHNANRGTERGATGLKNSLNQYGAGRSILVDKNGMVIAGNKTLEQARAMGLEVETVRTDGNKLVVVQREDLDLQADPKARELAIADNRVAQIDLEWDVEELKRELDDGIDLGKFWAEDELKEMLSLEPEEPPADPGAQVDKADELRDVWKTERGQLWVIPSKAVAGREHRLLCGDSTSEADVGKVMGGEKAGLMNTDPPYGVDYAAVKNGIPRYGFKDIQEKRGDIENDNLTDGPQLQAFLESMIRTAVPHLVGNPAFYLWHPMLTQGTFFAAAAAADILIHRQIIWVKPHMVLTRSGMYHWQHELCFYGWIKGHPCAWLGDKSQTSVWQLGESRQGRLHPTQKPVELFTRPMKNHLKKGEIAYEPFSGSGSQFIAAEQLGRLCYGIEIAPKYVAVCLQRLADMGLEPRLSDVAHG
jgi:DNA modification methylase